MVSTLPTTGPDATALPLLPIFNSLPGAYLLLSPELVIVAATDAFLASSGTRREQLLGHDVYAAFPAQHATTAQVIHNLRASLEQVLATGQPHDMAVQHYDLPDPDQSGQLVEHYWRPRNSPVLDAQGRVQYLVHAVENVTEEVRAAAALAASQAQEQAARAEAERQRQRLEQLFQQAPALINTQLGPDHVFDLVHPLTYQLLGHRPLVGLASREALPELEGPFHELLDRVYATGEPFQGQAVHARLDRHNNGQLDDAYFDFTYQPLYDAAGQVEGVMTFAVEVTEQVRARQHAEALQAELLTVAQRQGQERETFYQIFEQTPAAVCIQRGPEHRYTYVNPTYQALFPGLNFVGRSLAEALPEVMPQGFGALLDQVYHTGETYYGRELPVMLEATTELPARTAYFNFTYQAYREDGDIVGISTFAYDVTEQVQARQEQDQQQQRLQELFEQAPVAIFVVRGPDYLVDVVNPPMAEMLGYAPAALLGRPFFEVLPELATQGYQDLLADVWQTGRAHVALERPARLARHQADETGYFHFVYQPLRDAQNQITGVLCVATDVSEQVQARQQLAQAAQEMRMLLATTPAFIVSTDPAGHLTYVSEALFEWSGLKRQQLASLDEIWTLVHPDDLPGLQAEFMAAVVHKGIFESSAFRMRRRDGQYRWILGRAQASTDEHGQSVGYTGINLEIHEQVELQRQLARVNVDLDNFVYTASHDLKAPITNIEGLLHVLNDYLSAGAAPPPEVAQVLAMMQDSVDRFKRTISHLSDVLKLQKEQDQPATAVALAPVLHDVQLDLQPLIQQTQAQLETDVPADAYVRFTEKNLRSVLYNLLSNALKYRHPNRTPRVRISYCTEGESGVLRVQDNGLGIAPGQRQELFTMFRRLHSHVEGTGIGLYMVKRMVENAGGRIELESQPEAGTTFIVHFPQQPV